MRKVCFSTIFGGFFGYIVEARMRANTQRTTRVGRRQEGWEREGQNSGEETLGDLWKGEGWGGEHGVYKMDSTGTFRKESREFEGGGFRVD